MKKIVLIKLGGSLISDKTRINKANFIKIERLSKQIKELKKDYDLVIFTGAGGFGHPVAEKYKANLKAGIKEIRSACRKINEIVVDTLINQSGLKAKSVSPSDIAVYEDGNLFSLSYKQIILILKKKIIPVFHADLVEDKKLGTSILSMDKFLVDLGIFFMKKGFKIEKAIFAGITSGVFDQKGKVIPVISKKTFFLIKNTFYKGKGIDVSGGMKYKVEQCLRLTDKGIKSFITKDLLERGTLITSESEG